MSELPFVYELDPDEWFQQVQQVADELVEAVAESLDNHAEPRAVYESIEPKLEPYIIDEDDPTQPQLVADWRGDTVYIGQKEPDWYRLTHREDGYWWFKRKQPPGDIESQELHRRAGRKIVESMPWGNEQRAREIADEQKAKRGIVIPYLEALDEAGGGEATASQLRDDLRAFVQSCLPDDPDIQLQDRSPGDDFTHLVIRHGKKRDDHLLAVSPGTSRSPERLRDESGLDEISLEAGVVVVTDHFKFVWYPFLGTKKASNELIPLCRKDEDVVDFHYEIDWTVTQMIRSLNREG